MARDVLKEIVENVKGQQDQANDKVSELKIKDKEADAKLLQAESQKTQADAKAQEVKDKGLVAEETVKKLDREKEKIGNEALKTALETTEQKLNILKKEEKDQEGIQQASAPQQVSYPEPQVDAQTGKAIDDVLSGNIPTPQQAPMPAQPLIPQESPARREFMERVAQQEAIKKQVINKNYVREKRNMRMRLMNMDNQYRFYQNNPVSARNALANAGWIRTITAVLANIGSDINPDPQAQAVDHVQQLINEEVQAMKMERGQQMGALKERSNLYEKYLNILQDEHSAELATVSTISNMVGNLAKLNKQDLINDGLRLKNEKIGKEIEKLQEEISRRRTGKASSDDLIKIQKLWNEQERIKQGWARINQSKQEELGKFIRQEKNLTQRQKEFGDKILEKSIGFNTPTSPKIREFKFKTKKSAETVRNYVAETLNFNSFEKPRINQLVKDIKKSGAIGLAKSYTQLFTENKDAQKYHEILLRLSRNMLKNRIEFTGGGNMSDKEGEILREVFLAKDSKLALFNIIKQGKVGNLLKAMTAATFFNTLSKSSIHSSEFGKLSRGDQIYAVQRKLGIDDGEVREILKTSKWYRADLNAWENARGGTLRGKASPVKPKKVIKWKTSLPKKKKGG